MSPPTKNAYGSFFSRESREGVAATSASPLRGGRARSTSTTSATASTGSSARTSMPSKWPRSGPQSSTTVAPRRASAAAAAAFASGFETGFETEWASSSEWAPAGELATRRFSSSSAAASSPREAPSSRSCRSTASTRGAASRMAVGKSALFPRHARVSMSPSACHDATAASHRRITSARAAGSTDATASAMRLFCVASKRASNAPRTSW